MGSRGGLQEVDLSDFFGKIGNGGRKRVKKLGFRNAQVNALSGMDLCRVGEKASRGGG